MNNLEVKKRSLSYNEAYNWSILKIYGAYCAKKLEQPKASDGLSLIK